MCVISMNEADTFTFSRQLYLSLEIVEMTILTPGGNAVGSHVS